MRGPAGALDIKRKIDNFPQHQLRCESSSTLLSPFVDFHTSMHLSSPPNITLLCSESQDFAVYGVMSLCAIIKTHVQGPVMHCTGVQRAILGSEILGKAALLHRDATRKQIGVGRHCRHCSRPRQGQVRGTVKFIHRQGPIPACQVSPVFMDT